MPFNFSLQVPNTFSQVLHVVTLLPCAGDVLKRVSQVETVMEECLDDINRFDACAGLVVVWVVYAADGSSRIGLMFCQPSSFVPFW